MDAKFKMLHCEKVLSDKITVGGVDVGATLQFFQQELTNLKMENDDLKRKLAEISACLVPGAAGV